MQYSFRCVTCGHLEAAGVAGRNPQPHACSVCGTGIHFSRMGIKVTEPENWERLADATPARLAELGLTPAQVCAHTPHCQADDHARDAADCRAAVTTLEAKRDHWRAQEAALVTRYTELEAALAALPADPEDQETAERRQRARHDFRELETLAWTATDEANLVALQHRLVHGPERRTHPRHVFARAREGAASADLTNAKK